MKFRLEFGGDSSLNEAWRDRVTETSKYGLYSNAYQSAEGETGDQGQFLVTKESYDTIPYSSQTYNAVRTQRAADRSDFAYPGCVYAIQGGPGVQDTWLGLVYSLLTIDNLDYACVLFFYKVTHARVRDHMPFAVKGVPYVVSTGFNYVRTSTLFARDPIQVFCPPLSFDSDGTEGNLIFELEPKARGRSAPKAWCVGLFLQQEDKFMSVSEVLDTAHTTEAELAIDELESASNLFHKNRDSMDWNLAVSRQNGAKTRWLLKLVQQETQRAATTVASERPSSSASSGGQSSIRKKRASVKQKKKIKIKRSTKKLLKSSKAPLNGTEVPITYNLGLLLPEMTFAFQPEVQEKKICFKCRLEGHDETNCECNGLQ